MANTVKMKQSSVAGKVPTTAQLALGELAVNTYDGKLFFKKSVSGVESIVDVTAGLSGTFDQVFSTNNGNGTNYKVGDDAWIGDVNVANTVRITGLQNAANGYIIFGNSDSTALGRAGTGALTYGGNTVLTSATSAASFPTLNQNTTGNAATATTATNQSGGTVSATTGAFSGVLSPNGGIANGAVFNNAGSAGEGGELRLQKGATSTLSADVAFDLYNQSIRFFENGGTNRGASLDISAQSASVGSVILTSTTSAASFPTLNQNTTGTASNITAYTVNQNVGSSNSPTFAGLSVGSSNPIKFGDSAGTPSQYWIGHGGAAGTTMAFYVPTGNGFEWGRANSADLYMDTSGIFRFASSQVYANGVQLVYNSGTWGISVSGNAATASSVAWSGITSKPTTISGYGITDAITTGNIGSQSVNYAASSGSCSGNASTSSSLSGWNNPSTTNNGSIWPALSGVKSDGAMEIGRYLDFHNSSNDGVDYAVRLETGGTSSDLYLNNSILVTLAKFTNSFGSGWSGNYVKLPNGLIIQWGSFTYTGPTNSSQNFSFPLTFPTTVTAILVSVSNQFGDHHCAPVSNSAFNFRWGTSGSPLIYFVAIGY